jgi:hypothetical protein
VSEVIIAILIQSLLLAAWLGSIRNAVKNMEKQLGFMTHEVINHISNHAIHKGA